MIHVKKGYKTNRDGVLLTHKEYTQYKKLLTVLELFKSEKKQYDEVYRSSYM